MRTLERIRDRYTLEEELGRGGMALVYRARDEQLDRPVAVKLLAAHLGADEGLRERFVREARLAAQLQHPNVVAVYDAGEEDGRPFIVGELVSGPTVADRLAERGRLPAEEASRIVAGAARGLACAHEAGLVHRDVKPQNLLIARDGTVKVADFGIARAGESTGLTELGTILGTAAYIAPEQARGERVGPAADVYGLGAVLYELLTGRPPHVFRTLAELVERQQRAEIRPVGELAPHVPEALEELAMRCLALDPRYRPTAAEVADELGGGRRAGTAATLVRPQEPSRAPRRRAGWLLGAAAALAALAVGLGLALTRDDGGSEPVGPVPRGETPAQDARNLADWLREHGRE